MVVFKIMGQSSRSKYDSRPVSLGDQSQNVPAWAWALAIVLITLLVIVRLTLVLVVR
jgi:hypothetical protein